MPSIYAHYRFGCAMLEQLPPKAKKAVFRFRRLYDMGLHGPDMFFFYNPLVHTRVYDMGKRFHGESGVDFFTRAWEGLKQDPSEGGLAYLYGVLTHYCLDSVCHPYVKQMSLNGPLYHLEIESEFDRLLLERDGIPQPHLHDGTAHLKLTRGEYAEVARFYPGATAAQVKASIRNMIFFTKLLTRPEGLPRTVLKNAMEAIGPEQAGMLMPTAPNPRCGQTDQELLKLYTQAEARFPVLFSKLQALMENDTPLGEEFVPIFG